ncbi:hypothetical protein Bca52824_043736 [Brassica carinata]|uniref:Uncharacterized protein n=4 Tax=Brassica TaxID=3705 RepID=A0A8X7RZS2_BRACI|nr:hypothetical protein Bca52824_043736 [Brassica carinata]
MTFLVMPLGKQPYKPPFHMDTNSILGMAALFIAKRGIINIYRGSPRNYNNNTLQSSRCFTSQGSDGAGESSASMNEARQEAMGTSTDTKAPNVSVSYAADTAKEGLKRATELAKETSENHTETEDAAAMVAGGEDEKEENVTVGEIETLKGKNQSSS